MPLLSPYTCIVVKHLTNLSENCVDCNDPKFSERRAWANSVDPDQTAPKGVIHCSLWFLHSRLYETKKKINNQFLRGIAYSREKCFALRTHRSLNRSHKNPKNMDTLKNYCKYPNFEQCGSTIE